MTKVNIVCQSPVENVSSLHPPGDWDTTVTTCYKSSSPVLSGQCTKYFQPRNMNKFAFVVSCIHQSYVTFTILYIQVCLAACVSADADAFYGPYGYGGLAYSGLAGYPYAGVSAYSAPYLGYAAGYGVSNVANSVGIAGAAPAAIPAAPGLYAGAGRYVANSAGVVHVAKRSADAEPEADAAYLYGGYGYGAFGGAYPYGLGYNGFAGYPYGYPAVGYSAYYGKRLVFFYCKNRSPEPEIKKI